MLAERRRKKALANSTKLCYTYDKVNIFVFGITSMLMLIVLALFTTIIATFIPVRNAAKKKPVESIRVS